jgi:hypothetical protein
VLYTLRLRLATPSTKGESSVACVLRHVLRNMVPSLVDNNLSEPITPTLVRVAINVITSVA